MRETIKRLWPGDRLIADLNCVNKLPDVMKALERSSLKADGLNQIPFTLLVRTHHLMEHKRCVVRIALRRPGHGAFMGRALPVDTDTVIAGAILADVGKLLEYEIGPDGKAAR
jgi:hypothetical protein